jgi:hypothetical protein
MTHALVGQLRLARLALAVPEAVMARPACGVALDREAPPGERAM